MRRSGWVGRAAQRRRAAGGKLAVGRPSETAAGYRLVRDHVVARSRGRCEIRSYDHPGCDPHHVVPRSLGGADAPENIIWLCRWHHNMVDRPFVKGRLVIEALGGGKFSWAIVRKANKWAMSEEILDRGTT